MGNIKFEGSPPYALPIAQYVMARAEGAVVEMTLEVITPGKEPSTGYVAGNAWRAASWTICFLFD
ncbi:MAG: hypothetical protein E6G80_15595 [Alphaproteobacteria bacterium]|nr:MAG: hypothetical protein E6G80_15595 [Alphaproteobacteria bacterium]